MKATYINCVEKPFLFIDVQLCGKPFASTSFTEDDLSGTPLNVHQKINIRAVANGDFHPTFSKEYEFEGEACSTPESVRVFTPYMAEVKNTSYANFMWIKPKHGFRSIGWASY